MRAALLPAGSDPFLLAYWLRNYRTWADQVDELRIVMCGQEDPIVLDYLSEEVVGSLPHATIRFTHRTDHGEIIKQLVNETNADYILLCEDDAFVRKPEKIGEVFNLIESNQIDIVGCPRATGSEGILNWARSRFGDWHTITGESGPILWPCFLFAKRSNLLNTDQRFGAWGWKIGDTVLGYTCPQDEAMDTFGWATLQLREMGLRIDIEPNYRAQIEMLTKWTNAPWFHVGGLSTGFGLYLLGDPSSDQARLEAIRSDPYDWEKRMSWWIRITNHWDGALMNLHADYTLEIIRYMGVMNPASVAEWYSRFQTLITWKE